MIKNILLYAMFALALVFSNTAHSAPTTHREFVEALDNVGTLASGDETYVRDVSAAGSLQSKSMTIANIGTFVIASDAEIAALAGLTSAAAASAVAFYAAEFN